MLLLRAIFLTCFLCVIHAQIVIQIEAITTSIALNGNTLYIKGNDCGLNKWQTALPMQGTKFSPTGTRVKWSIDLDVSQCSPIVSTPNGLQFKFILNNRTWALPQSNYRVKSFQPANVLQSRALPTFYPWFSAQAGEYAIIGSLYSPVLKNSRDAIAYVPRALLENTAAPIRNVLIMHDGENVFNDSTAFQGVSWRASQTLDALIENGSVNSSMIVVALYNTLERNSEYTPTYDPAYGFGGKGDLYLNFIETVAIPFIQKFFAPRLIQPTQNIQYSLLGSSLGGLISCYAGWTRQTYASVGCMSSSFWWNNEHFLNVFMKNQTNAAGNNYYLDSGTAGPGNDDENQTIAVRNEMRRVLPPPRSAAANNVYYYKDVGGRHNERYWGARFWRPMVDLFGAQNLTLV